MQSCILLEEPLIGVLRPKTVLYQRIYFIKNIVYLATIKKVILNICIQPFVESVQLAHQ